MGFVPSGGYIVLAGKRTYRRVAKVDENTLAQIAELLGIKDAERDRLIANAQSIYIYRGGGRPRQARSRARKR
jgi:hypothetical protein